MSGEYMEFTMVGKTLSLKKSVVCYGELSRKGFHFNEACKPHFRTFYDEYGSLKKVLDSFEELIWRLVDPIVDILHKELAELPGCPAAVTRDFFKEKFCQPHMDKQFYREHYYQLREAYKKQENKHDEANSRLSVEVIDKRPGADLSAVKGYVAGTNIANFFLSMFVDSPEEAYQKEETRELLFESVTKAITGALQGYGHAVNEILGAEYYDMNAAPSEYKNKTYRRAHDELLGNRKDEKRFEKAGELSLNTLPGDPANPVCYRNLLMDCGDPDGGVEAFGEMFLPGEVVKSKIEVFYFYYEVYAAGKLENWGFFRKLYDKTIHLCDNWLHLPREHVALHFQTLDMFAAAHILKQIITSPGLSRINGSATVDNAHSELMNSYQWVLDKIPAASPHPDMQRFFDQLQKALEDCRLLIDCVNLTEMGVRYATREEADRAQERLAPVMEALGGANFGDHTAVQALKTLVDSQTGSAITPEEAANLHSRIERAAALSATVDSFLAQANAAVCTYRYEKVWYLCKAEEFRHELDLLDAPRSDLSEWIDKTYRELCYIRGEFRGDILVSSKAFFEEVKQAADYCDYRQRQNSQRGFFKKLTSVVSDTMAKKHEGVYAKVTENGTKPIPPTVEGELDMICANDASMWDARNAMAKSFREQYDSPAAQAQPVWEEAKGILDELLTYDGMKAASIRLMGVKGDYEKKRAKELKLW